MPTTDANAVTTPPNPSVGADYVMSFRETAALANVGLSSLKYLVATGRGPRVTRPSPRRVGVRMSHFIEWLNERED